MECPVAPELPRSVDASQLQKVNEILARPDAQFNFRVVYAGRRAMLTLTKTVLAVHLEADEEGDGGAFHVSTSKVVMHAEDLYIDSEEPFIKVTFQPWTHILNTGSGKKGEMSPDVHKFTLARSDACRLSVIAMAIGIVQISFNEVWRITKFLGSGGFSNVYKAENAKSVAAVKISRRKFSIDDLEGAAKAWRKLQREVEVLRDLQGCSNVPQLFGSYMLRTRDDGSHKTTLCVVMQLLPVSLSGMRKLRAFSELEVRSILRDILTALFHFHSRGVVHRDVKISNVMLQSEEGPAYLVDFGFASRIESLRGGIAGTAGYLAPEFFEGSHHDARCGDIYSTGLVFYNLLSSQPAFVGPDVEAVLEANKVGVINYEPVEPLLTAAGLQLCEALSARDPGLRPSASQALNGDWLAMPGRELTGFPPNPQSSRYGLQRRGLEVDGTGSSTSTREDPHNSLDLLDDAMALAEQDQKTGSVWKKTGGSPIKCSWSEGSATPLSPRPSTASGAVLFGRDEEPSGVSKTTQGEAFVGSYAYASRRSKGSNRSTGQRRMWGDIVNAGIIESLRSAAGKTRASLSGLSKGFEISMRSSQTFQSQNFHSVTTTPDENKTPASRENTGKKVSPTSPTPTARDLRESILSPDPHSIGSANDVPEPPWSPKDSNGSLMKIARPPGHRAPSGRPPLRVRAPSPSAGC